MRSQLPVLSVLSSWIEFDEKETVFVSNSEATRLRAEASFKKKELQVRQGAEAVAAYEAAGRAVEKNTARLKALRLAKEERDRQAAAAKKSGPPAHSN
jgi:DNA-binding FadR family transcriptional regulator